MLYKDLLKMQWIPSLIGILHYPSWSLCSMYDSDLTRGHRSEPGTKNSGQELNLSYNNMYSSGLRDDEAEKAEQAKTSDNYVMKNSDSNPNKPFDYSSALIEKEENSNSVSGLGAFRKNDADDSDIELSEPGWTENLRDASEESENGSLRAKMADDADDVDKDILD